MENMLQVFENQEFGKIRTLIINHEPWLVGKDVANILGYVDLNKAISMHVDVDDKKLNDKTSPSFGQRGATLINESGLYSLALSSKLPTAKRFKHWVTSEILPSIRKTGSYSIYRGLPNFANPSEAARAWADQFDARQKLEKQAKIDQPKILFAESVAVTNTSMLIRELAKIITQNRYTIGEKRLYEWLRNHGYLIKKLGKDYNKPTQRSMDMKLFVVTEIAVNHHSGVQTHTTTRVTGKGQIYFVNIFKKKVDGLIMSAEQVKALKEGVAL